MKLQALITLTIVVVFAPQVRGMQNLTKSMIVPPVLVIGSGVVGARDATTCMGWYNQSIFSHFRASNQLFNRALTYGVAAALLTFLSCKGLQYATKNSVCTTSSQNQSQTPENPVHTQNKMILNSADSFRRYVCGFGGIVALGVAMYAGWHSGAFGYGAYNWKTAWNL